MKIRKYVARTYSEALQQARDDLGDGAVILNKKQIRRNSRFNIEDEARVEITVASDKEDAPASCPKLAPLSQRVAAGQRYRDQLDPQGSTGLPEKSVVDFEPILAELRDLRNAVSRGDTGNSVQVELPSTLRRLADRLRNMGLDHLLSRDIVQQLLEELDGQTLGDRVALVERTRDLLVQRMPECKEIRIGRKGRKVVGFVGTSGSGKTTAAAKIAAGFTLKRRGRIVLVSADNRRIGALDQGRAFAEIVGVTLEVAYDGPELKSVLARHADARLILVDCPGCGPHDHREWDRLRRLLETADVDETQVVLDSLLGMDHMLDVIEASCKLRERRLLFTKMDEAVRSGVLLSAAALCTIPTSYFTIGREVPGAIRPGDLSAVVADLLGVASAPATGDGQD